MNFRLCRDCLEITFVFGTGNKILLSNHSLTVLSQSILHVPHILDCHKTISVLVYALHYVKMSLGTFLYLAFGLGKTSS